MNDSVSSLSRAGINVSVSSTSLTAIIGKRCTLPLWIVLTRMNDPFHSAISQNKQKKWSILYCRNRGSNHGPILSQDSVLANQPYHLPSFQTCLFIQLLCYIAVLKNPFLYLLFYIMIMCFNEKFWIFLDFLNFF